MKKTLFNLTYKEKTRILEMHKKATLKEYLMENVEDDETKKRLIIDTMLLIDKITSSTFNFDAMSESDYPEIRSEIIKLSDLQASFIPLLKKYKISMEQYKDADFWVNILSNTYTGINNFITDINNFITELESLINKNYSDSDMKAIKNDIEDMYNKLLDEKLILQ